jgi:anti-anti-sigma factor
MQLRLSTRTVDGVLVVDCSGRIVFGEESASLRDAVKKLLAGSPKVVLNLRDVTYIDSGGLGTLCETLEGKVENLNYNTVRYPGHRDIVKMLIRDLRLGQRREILKDVLEESVPMTHQDVVLVFVTVSGMREGRLTQESFAKKIYSKMIDGKLYSAIQVTTAAGICAMVDMMREGTLPKQGFVRQEEAKLETFLANRFGQHYA